MQVASDGINLQDCKAAIHAHEVLESLTRYSGHLTFAVWIIPVEPMTSQNPWQSLEFVS